MLSSAFSESTPSTYPSDPHHPPRKIHDIVVSEADFITVYWLLKWVYADWIMFKDNDDDDPRAVMNGMGGGWSVKSLGQGSEWEWRPVVGEQRLGREPSSPDARDDDIARSVTSTSSIGTGTSGTGEEHIPLSGTESNKGKMPAYTSTRGGSSSRGGRTPGSTSSRGASVSAAATSARRPSANHPSKAPPSIQVPPPAASSSSYVPPSASRTSVSPNHSRYPPSIQINPDPHVHPTASLPPASALAIYQVAHRYSLPGLQSLALDHMMNTITPKSAFPLLLASHFWEELHCLIEDYIVDHFDAVSR